MVKQKERITLATKTGLRMMLILVDGVYDATGVDILVGEGYCGNRLAYLCEVSA